jgi:hypothetical protein
MRIRALWSKSASARTGEVVGGRREFDLLVCLRCLIFISQREKFCSHLNAGLQMLVYWFENPDKVGTVRHSVFLCTVVLIVMFKTYQCVRAAPLRKPDVELRKHPLQKVLAATDTVTDQILFHPEKLRHWEKRRRCFCKVKSEQNMTLCETCWQWYHLGCVGLSAEEAHAAVDWKCGYCIGKPGADGMCSWKLAIPQGNRKRKKVAPERDSKDTPRARGVGADEDDLQEVGPRSWQDVVDIAKAGGRAINLEMQANKRKAQKIVKERGHHVVDEMTAVGLQLREVDDELIDDLLGQGLLDEDEDQLSASEGDEN